MNISLKTAIASMGASMIALLTTSIASATVINFDISQTNSWDGPGDSNNELLSFDLGSNVTLTGIGWDVNIQTVDPSWLSEANILFTDSSNSTLFFLTPGLGNDFLGTANFSTGGVIIDLGAALGNTFFLPDGVINLEFFESFDDFPDQIDATFLVPSTLSFQVMSVPEPTSLLALGILGVGFASSLYHKKK